MNQSVNPFFRAEPQNMTAYPIAKPGWRQKAV